MLNKQVIIKAMDDIKYLKRCELANGWKFPWETEYNINPPVKANKDRKK